MTRMFHGKVMALLMAMLVSACSTPSPQKTVITPDVAPHADYQRRAMVAENSAGLTRSSSPDLREKIRKQAEADYASHASGVTFGTTCEQGCTTQPSKFDALTQPERSHRTDRLRQSDDFSTNQEGKSQVWASFDF